MDVYILVEEVNYRYATVIGVYLTKKEAETRMKEIEDSADFSDDLVDSYYKIEKHWINGAV